MADRFDDIERYRKNQMTNAERHALEKKALSDPFLADALEGAESVEPGQFSNDVVALQRRVGASGPSRFAFTARLAAGFAIIISAGWLIWRSQSAPPELAVVQQVADSTVVKPVDTANQVLTLAQPQTRPAESQVRSQARESKPNPASTAGPATAAQQEPVTVARTEPAAVERADEIVADEKAEAVAEEEVKEAVAATKNVAEPVATEYRADDRDRSAKDSRKSAAGQSAMKKIAGEERSEVNALAPSSPGAKQNQADAMVVGTTAAPTGGIEAYRKYLEETQQVPEQARSASAHGRVTVNFTVAADGTLSGFTVVKSVGFGCDEELIRLIQHGPTWAPALSQGKAVPSTVSVSLDF